MSREQVETELRRLMREENLTPRQAAERLAREPHASDALTAVLGGPLPPKPSGCGVGHRLPEIPNPLLS